MRKAKPVGFRDLIWVSLCITLGSVTGITNRVPKCGVGNRESFHLYSQQVDLRDIYPWTGSQRNPKDHHLIWKMGKGFWEMQWIIWPSSIYIKKKTQVSSFPAQFPFLSNIQKLSEECLARAHLFVLLINESLTCICLISAALSTFSRLLNPINTLPF